MSKIALSFGIISLLVAALDFSYRLYPTIDLSDEDFEKAGINVPKVMLLPKSLENTIDKELAEYDVVKPPSQHKNVVQKSEPKEFIMPEEQQNQQQGKLDVLYSGVNKYRLVATFMDTKRKMAVVEQTDLKTGSGHQVKLQVGTSLSGYRVDEISGTIIKLHRDNRVVELSLFKKPNSKN